MGRSSPSLYMTQSLSMKKILFIVLLSTVFAFALTSLGMIMVVCGRMFFTGLPIFVYEDNPLISGIEFFGCCFALIVLGILTIPFIRYYLHYGGRRA